MIRLLPIHVHAAGVCSLCAVAAGVYVLGVQSRFTSERQDAAVLASISDLESEFAELERSAHAFEVQNRSIERASERGKGLRTPSDRNAVLAQIAQIAGDSGLDIDEIVPGTGVVSPMDESFLTTPIRFLARGDIGEVLETFSEIHASMPGVEVMGFEISADPFVNRPGSVSISFSWHADRSE